MARVRTQVAPTFLRVIFFISPWGGGILANRPFCLLHQFLLLAFSLIEGPASDSRFTATALHIDDMAVELVNNFATSIF